MQVVGVPSEKYGEEVIAYIQLKNGNRDNLTQEDFRGFCDKKIAFHKIPRVFFLR